MIEELLVLPLQLLLHLGLFELWDISNFDHIVKHRFHSSCDVLNALGTDIVRQLTSLERNVRTHLCFNLFNLRIDFFHFLCLNCQFTDLSGNDLSLTLDVIVLSFNLHLILFLSDCEFFKGGLAI